MKPRIPYKFSNGYNLSPSKLNSNFERMTKDLMWQLRKRYSESAFKLDFTGLASTDAATSAQYLIKAPWAYEITGVELVLVDSAVTACTLSASGTTAGWKDVTFSSIARSGRNLVVSNLSANVAANTEITFSLSVTGTGWTLDKCYAIVHIRADRFRASGAGYSFSENTLPRIGSNDSVSASQLNTAFSDYETGVTADTSQSDNMRIEVYSARNIPSSIGNNGSWRIPASGRICNSMDVVNCGAATNNLTATLTISTGTAVTVNGSASPPAKTQGTSVAKTQVNDPATTGSDTTLVFTRAGASTIPLGYAVLYWS